MKLKYIIYIICVFSLLALVVGCAKPPLAEMENAREIVFRAGNDEDAALYGISSLNRARVALIRMQTSADSKRYDAARTEAAEAIAAAERAIAEGREGAVRARQEAASQLSNLVSEIDETNKNISGARYSLLDLDYNTLDRDIRNAYDMADQAGVDHAGGRYQDALDKARAIRSDLFNINQQISSAVTRKK